MQAIPGGAGVESGLALMTRYEPREESHDLLNQYLHEIAQVPRLTPERERELGFLVRDHRDMEARQELVQANLRFVVSYAKRFRSAHVHLLDFLDLISEGNIGLIHAAEKFDPDKNVKFITYAVWWIRQSILQALSDHGGAFRLPPKQANLMYKLARAIEAAMASGGQMPSAEELAAQLSVSAKEVQTLLYVRMDSYSLNAEIDDDSHAELGGVIEQTSVPSADDEMQRKARTSELLSGIARLPDRERLVLALRHGLSVSSADDPDAGEKTDRQHDLSNLPEKERLFLTLRGNADNLPRGFEELASMFQKPVPAVVELIDAATAALCDALKLSAGELAEMLLYTSSHPQARSVFWNGADEASNHTVAGDDARQAVLLAMRRDGAVQRAVELLPLEQRTLLKLRYGVFEEELTLRDIGEILGLSRERVRQIEARAEMKYRRSVKRDQR